ncbi:MAG TPA: hypothetical protein VK308_07130 [Pyrinomonadaceae bacterium]|nr:hypothetical protein [Pyrinomonadaceae bacterium]
MNPRLDDNRKSRSPAATKILAWSQPEKGIDDALLQSKKLDEITILDWSSALNNKCRDEVRKVWA